jgi:hypothetical protein
MRQDHSRRLTQAEPWSPWRPVPPGPPLIASLDALPTVPHGRCSPQASMRVENASVASIFAERTRRPDHESRRGEAIRSPRSATPADLNSQSARAFARWGRYRRTCQQCHPCQQRPACLARRAAPFLFASPPVILPPCPCCPRRPPGPSAGADGNRPGRGAVRASAVACSAVACSAVACSAVALSDGVGARMCPEGRTSERLGGFHQDEGDCSAKASD